MSERGNYRSISIVLYDGPDFQQLSPIARAVFLCIKCSVGLVGLEVQYRESFIPVLARRTGFTIEQVTSAVRELETATQAWIRWEANVIWVIGQLKHDPHLNVDDRKHRAGVRKKLMGLPRLAIVAEFCRAHREWLRVEDKEGRLVHEIDPELAWAFDDAQVPLPRPPEGPSEGQRRAIEAEREVEEEREVEQGEERESVAAGAAPSLALVKPARAIGRTRQATLATGRRYGDVVDSIAAVFEEVGQQTARRRSREEVRRVAAEMVFAYWAKKLEHPNALLDDKRLSVLTRRLKENGENADELFYVIDGALMDDWTMGRTNRSEKRYDGIETIFKTRAKVEELAALVKAYRDGVAHPKAEKLKRIVLDAAVSNA